MKLADILQKHPAAEIEVKTSASFYDGTIDYEIPRDTLEIPSWACPDSEGATGDYGDDIDAVIRDYVTPGALRAIDFDDYSDDDMSFDGNGYYAATIKGRTRPDPYHDICLDLHFNVYIIL